MLESLTKRLDAVFKGIRGKGLISAEVLEQTLREVRLALLEADVHFTLVKPFIETIRLKAAGAEVTESLTPGLQVIKIVREALTGLMGHKVSGIALAACPPTILMLVGLQGSGKTTTAGKLARRYKSEGRRVLLVAADLQRPAAVDQLQVHAKRLEVVIAIPQGESDPVEVVEKAVVRGRDQGFDLVIIDTAGRLEVDERLMAELVRMKSRITPHEILLVADAMTGQAAIKVAQVFHDQLHLTGTILTKTEGDARGGAVLSIRSVTGTPIKFMGVGEQLDALELFHPDRMASRILGMGDMQSLLEMAEKKYTKEEAVRLQEKIQKEQFTLEDFREQMKQLKTIGSVEKILEMIPGMKKMQVDQAQVEGELKSVEAMISSMTPGERQHPAVINGSRRKRIANGSGTSVQEVNRLLKQFQEAQKMMRQFSGMKKGGMGRLFAPRQGKVGRFG
jgi:signal recognition particle subunit SRP54